MITIYRYLPAWTVPCISPYVTKAIYYMHMAEIKYEAKNQDLTKLDMDTPAREAAHHRRHGRHESSGFHAHHRISKGQVRRPAGWRGQRRGAGSDACLESDDR